MRRYLALLIVLAGLGGVAAPPVALASGSDVLHDCNNNGKLTRHYSTAELRNALATMPSSTREYTDCQDVIQRQLLAQLAGSSGSGGGSDHGSGGSFLPTPLIVVLVLLALAAATFGAIAVRRRVSNTDAASDP